MVPFYSVCVCVCSHVDYILRTQILILLAKFYWAPSLKRTI